MEKYNKFIVILIVVVVLAMSIGYSVLNSELSISGEVIYRPQDGVRITSFVANDKPDDMTIEYSDFSKHQVKLGYTTTGACSITYTVKVENYSSVSMGLVSVDVNGQDNNVEIQDNIIGKMIVDSAEEKTFNITFKSTQKETKTYLLTFEFVQIYTVTYNDLGDTDGYIKGVFEGGKLEQNLGTGADVCSVTIGESTTDNYTFTDETITIENVTGNVVINGFVSVTEAPTTPPNPPELNGDMIPVYYHKIDDKNGEWRKADKNNANNGWYNYDNQEWANAVTVVESGKQKRDYYKNAEVGTIIPMDDINTMWVWIPRYSYTIKSEDGTNYYGKKTSCIMPTRTLPGEIDVKFISKDESEKGNAQYKGDEASGWYTNEAFDFPKTDEEEANTPTKRGGIWVGKFETTGTLDSQDVCVDKNCDVSKLSIKPDTPSLRSQRISSFFYAARSMQLNNASAYGFDATSGDLHMMKNDEWGAVAYLSQSRYGKYGNSDYTGANKEVYINNDSDMITGHSGGSPSASKNSEKYSYNDMTNLENGKGQVGPGASTTGNIYGIYDMSGGAYEYVMGVLEYDEQGVFEHDGKIATGSSYFKGLSSSGSATGSYELPNEKYYNKYKSANPTSNNFASAKPELACDDGICYGHALSETYGASSGSEGWYRDSAIFVSRSYPWFARGGHFGHAAAAGVFYSYGYVGYAISSYSCRLAFVP